MEEKDCQVLECRIFFFHVSYVFPIEIKVDSYETPTFQRALSVLLFLYILYSTLRELNIV